MSASPSGTYADNSALYDKALAAVPGVERKGDTVPYTSLNGQMFSYLSNAGVMALRLPEKDREAFLKKYATRLCTQSCRKNMLRCRTSSCEKPLNSQNFLKSASLTSPN